MPPQLLVSSLPDSMEAGAMTPSSTMAEDGDEAFARSMPATPIASATTDLPPPVHDLVPGNLTLATGGLAGSGINSAPSLSSSLASQYEASVDEENSNLKDVSGVSTPTGTPRQAHRDLDDRSVAGSSRSGPEEDSLEDKLQKLDLEKTTDGKSASEAGSGNAPSVTVERSETPTVADAADSHGVPIGAPLRPAKSPEVLAAEEALQKAEVAAREAEEAVKPAEMAVKTAEETTPASPGAALVTPITPMTPAVDAPKSKNKKKNKKKKSGSKSEQDEKTPTEESKEKTPTGESKEKTPTEESTKSIPEAGASEVLAAEKDNDAEAKDDDMLDQPRTRSSEDTLRPVRSINSATVSNDRLDRETTVVPDRDATPQPPGTDDGREETPMPSDFTQPPALDDDSDIISVAGAVPSERGLDDNASPICSPALQDSFDINSNRSSMPPARASSELEFSYEEYADQFFRDSQQRDGSEASNGAQASAVGDAPAAAVAGSQARDSARAGQDSSKKDVGVSFAEELKRFPSVPTSNVDGGRSSARKPVQVHVEPSPFGPVSGKATVVSPDLAVPTTPAVTVQAPSPSSANFASDSQPAPDFPNAPSNDLPEAKTPADSNLPSRSGTPPGRSGSITRSFPAVPDEEHPYVEVHMSPHHSSPQNPFPGERTASPPMESPNLSVDGHEPFPPRKKRNSFTPRSPHLDDEDPGDFEPGEGWAVVANREPWKGSPPERKSFSRRSNERRQ